MFLLGAHVIRYIVLLLKNRFLPYKHVFRDCIGIMLVLNVPSKTGAGNIYYLFLFFFLKKLDIFFFLWQTILMECKALPRYMYMSQRMTIPAKWHVSPAKDQPGHLPSLIRVFTVRMKKAWVLRYPLSAQRRLISSGRCPG